MRKTKRIIALVVVAMFLLSLAAPAAFAATKEDAFGRLNALSVAVGDQTGDPQYDKNFTRAEAAAIMVNLSGMKAAIDAAKGATKFKDVPASHWASGVVNLAVGSGIIKGYPDGTYKPDQNVSYAEMSAMLVGVLGYTPKLQGTWPSNVIGKAAQLGLLDGLSVTDYNAAAIRANVFLASDNALDTKPLKETKDGYEEDTKTLMEAKLSVIKKAKGTVTATPSYGAVDKGKLTITFPTVPATSETLTCVDGLNPDDYMGLEAEAWVKDDKAFFLDVKTDASSIINDKLIYAFDGATKYVRLGSTTVLGGDGDKVNENDVDEIQIDTGDKKYATDAGTIFYKNFVLVADANVLNSETPVKIIIGTDGKADYVFATAMMNAVVDSVSTTDEKITLDSDSLWAGANSTIDLKTKKVKIYRNGKAASLGDLKKGDLVSYVDGGATSDSRLIYAVDTEKSGKITGVVDDGTFKVKASGASVNKFKFYVGSETLTSAKYVLYSTNDGDTYTTATDTSSFAAVMNKDVKIKLDKNGKVAYITASSAAGSNEIEALVKDIKLVSSTETKRYLYVAKFDGTETYYEVTKDSKIGSVKISDYALRASDGTTAVPADANYSTQTGPHICNINYTNEVKVGDVIRFTLNSDNTIDNIVKETPDNGTSYTVSKDNNTIAATGFSAVLVNDATKILWVKSQAPATTGNAAGIYSTQLQVASPIDDVDSASWTAVKAPDGTVNSKAAVVKDAGKAKYIVVYDPAATISSSDMFGIVLEIGKNASSEDYIKIAHDDKKDGESLLGTPGVGVAKGTVVKFTLKADATKLNTNTLEAADTVVINSANYTYFKVESVSGTQIKVSGTDANYTTGGPTDYVLFDTAKTKFWNVDNTPYENVTSNDISGKYIQVYDLVKSDGTTGTDGVYDYIVVVKN